MIVDNHVDRLLQRYPTLAPTRQSIELACRALEQCFKSGGKVLLCGNGGSAADCDHIVGELVKAFRIKRPLNEDLRSALKQAAGDDGMDLSDTLQGGLPALNLAAQSALITAIANDLDPAAVFAQQVIAYGCTRDVLVALSTSGKSVSIVCALIAARSIGMTTVGLTGGEGGEMERYCDIVVRAPGGNTAEIQELHLPVYHAICSVVEDKLFSDGSRALRG